MANGRRWRVVILVTALLTLGAAVPAFATQFQKTTPYSNSYSFDNADCGFPIHVDGVQQGKVHVRQGTGKDATAFFAHDQYSFSETWTNTDTNAYFTVSGNGLFNEVKATQVSGSIFEFRSVNSGQPFVVHDSSGNLVIKDRGTIQETILFDTLGDDVPGGNFIEIVSDKVHGPHPGFFIDICDVAESLIGS
jgi:hypothetical protein